MIGENNLVFREVQKFGLWFYLLAAFSNLAVIGVLCFLLLFRQNDIPSEATIPLLVVIIIILVVSTFFLLGIRLETKVRGDGLYVRFFPIHIRFKKFAAEDLDECLHTYI